MKFKVITISLLLLLMVGCSNNEGQKEKDIIEYAKQHIDYVLNRETDYAEIEIDGIEYVEDDTYMYYLIGYTVTYTETIEEMRIVKGEQQSSHMLCRNEILSPTGTCVSGYLVSSEGEIATAFWALYFEKEDHNYFSFTYEE